MRSLRRITWRIPIWAGLIVLAVLGAADRAQAERVVYQTDLQNSEIHFLAKMLGITTDLGRFRDFSVDLRFDRNNPAASSLDVTVLPASVDTGAAPLNEELRSPALFDAKAYPQMKFVASDIRVTGKNVGLVTGDLSLKGLTRPITLQVSFEGAGPEDTGRKVSFVAIGKIDRAAYGMDAYSLIFSDEVRLVIHYTGIAERR